MEGSYNSVKGIIDHALWMNQYDLAGNIRADIVNYHLKYNITVIDSQTIYDCVFDKSEHVERLKKVVEYDKYWKFKKDFYDDLLSCLNKGMIAEKIWRKRNHKASCLGLEALITNLTWRHLYGPYTDLAYATISYACNDIDYFNHIHPFAEKDLKLAKAAAGVAEGETYATDTQRLFTESALAKLLFEDFKNNVIHLQDDDVVEVGCFPTPSHIDGYASALTAVVKPFFHKFAERIIDREIKGEAI
jgi:hypothetical protein|nr:MAG TPA: hypothetical protein [Caudoviricetes sp.]